MKNSYSDNIFTELAEVTKIYNSGARETIALKNISFRAQKGEIILLLGPSGSGKSTFLTIMAGLQPATRGDVFLFGKKINVHTSGELQKIRAKHIGFIFQTFYLIESLTALENIMIALKFAGFSRNESDSLAVNYLEKFGVKYLMNSYPKTMSQGEKQRVAVARALANGSELIIADEPTGSLATDQGMEIIRYLHESTRKDERCVIIASHDERISQYADRVLQLQDGRLLNQ